MKDWTIVQKRKFKNPPAGITVDGKAWTIYEYDEKTKRSPKRYVFKVTFDMCNLDHVNYLRKIDGKEPFEHLNGYCMSTGCSCRHPDGSKGIPICGLFKLYESDGVKRDFIHQIFGI